MVLPTPGALDHSFRLNLQKFSVARGKEFPGVFENNKRATFYSNGFFSEVCEVFCRMHDVSEIKQFLNFHKVISIPFSPFSIVLQFCGGMEGALNVDLNLFSYYLFISRFVYTKYIQVLEQKDITSPTRFNHLTRPQPPKRIYVRNDRYKLDLT